MPKRRNVSKTRATSPVLSSQVVNCAVDRRHRRSMRLENSCCILWILGSHGEKCSVNCNYLIISQPMPFLRLRRALSHPLRRRCEDVITNIFGIVLRGLESFKRYSASDQTLPYPFRFDYTYHAETAFPRILFYVARCVCNCFRLIWF